MNLEQQVCSLELAKRLKELGIKQESLFYYRAWENPLINHVSESRVTDDYWCLYYHEDKYYKCCDWEIAAFTVAELGEMLPKAIQIKTEEEEKKVFSNFRLVTGRSLIFEEDKPCEFWSVNYICDTTNQFRNWLFDTLLTKAIYDKNEANVRAKMIIYLIENGLIKLNQLNKGNE
jgi:hypothetical protein